MLEVVYGQTKKHTVASQLNDALQSMRLTGTLYIGYPVLASADETIGVDALLVSREHGLIVFLFGDVPPKSMDRDAWKRLSEDQDRLYFAVKNHLSRHTSLRAGRELGVKIQTVTIFPTRPRPPTSLEGLYTDIGHLSEIIGPCPPLDDCFWKPLQAALQRVTTIKPVKKRAKVTRATSRGAILKQIEQEIANLDQWQKRAAIESPDGPQRIRGLAGSGKTVVLALKAAYLHAQHPEWTIAVTFQTRSLYQQFEDLIRRFSFEHVNDEPDWQNLRVIHAWGSRDRDGLYTEIAKHCQITPRDFLYGKTRFGMGDAFRGVCAELLSATANTAVEPLYDAVLIDEAQDLPPPFFQLVYRFTRPPKRVVWAYDELQKLSEAGMATVDELFGTDDRGDPLVQLANTEGQPQQDIILPVCYRNTPWALTLAHALGFGIYRKGGLIQHFDDPALWTEIGYRLISGNFASGKRVTLERDPGSYPKYFLDLLNSEDAVVSKIFENEIAQATWVAQSIQQNLREDELEHDDILIVLPNAYLAQRKAVTIIEALDRLGISAHLAGVTSSRDEIFAQGSIAIANIYRSKGNEAPMVYVLDCQHCVTGHELITQRNILFTAITRCRAWVRLCGWGPEMELLETEIRAVRDRKFRLQFTVPTAVELAKLRQIHRERTADERARIEKAEKSLKDFLDAVHRGDLAIENLPLELRTDLAKYLASAAGLDDDAE